MGIPIVVSDFPLYKGVIEQHKCGLSVNPDDGEAIITALRFLLKNPKKATEMGRRGQVAVRQHYNWSNELEKLCKFYTTILRDS